MPFSRLARTRFAVLLPVVAFVARWLTGCGNSTVTGCSLLRHDAAPRYTRRSVITTTANDALTQI